MSSLFIILAPLFGFALFSSVRKIAQAVKTRNSDAIKVNVLFLGLIVVVATMLALGIHNKDA